MPERAVNIVITGLLLSFAVFAWDLENDFSAENLDGGSSRFRRQTTPSKNKCNNELIKNLRKSCCKLPSFFGNGTWHACKKSIHGTEKDDKATPEQRFCVAQCVFQNKSLMASDGNVDIGKMTAALLANKDASWAPLLQTTVSSCISSVGALAPLPTKSGGKTCNPAPASIMWCIRRQCLLSCPSASKLAGSNCATDLQTLVSCVTPPALRKSNITATG